MSTTAAPDPTTTTQTTTDGKWIVTTKTTITAAPAPVVVPPPASGLVLLPPGVTPTITLLDGLTNWKGEWDSATHSGGKDAQGNVIPGAKGTTSYPVAIGGRQARAFPSDYLNHGGMRYHVQYATDTAARSFIFGGDLYFEGELPDQMELDNNQVTADGKTYIFGVQCNGNDGLWDITYQDTRCHWKGSTAKGDPAKWPKNTWVHFEIMCHRDDSGNVIYDSVHFNGVTQFIATVLPSARALGWTVGHCLVNLQLGGASLLSGSIRCYGSNMQVARW
jgi:hypothetical protein